METCPACGGCYPDRPDATSAHPYMLSTPDCWAAFGDWLAREYADPVLFAAAHRLTVDAYALQHPGAAGDRRAERSVWLHFAALDAIFMNGTTHATATDVMGRLSGAAYPPRPPAPDWPLTLADLDPAAHVMETERWARAAHAGWAPLLRPALTRLLG